MNKFQLNTNGILEQTRLQPYHKDQAKKTPAKRLGRLQELFKTKKPHICVVRGEGIGDVLMTTPTIRAIKNMFEEVDITYATNTKYLDGSLVKVLQYNPDIKEVIERNLMDDVDFDVVVNLHCPCIFYEKRDNPPINRIDIFANHTGVQLLDSKPRYFMQKEEIEWGKNFVSHLQKRTIILSQPFASTERRSLDLRKTRDALEKLATKYNIFNLVVTHDSNFHSDIMWNSIPNTMELRNFDIRQLAAIMVHCDLILCPDSSLLHLAGALGVPTVGLFGPTPPMARIDHYPNATAIWRGDGVGPCPCVTRESLVLTQNGYKEIEFLEPGEIVQTVDAQWNKVIKVHQNPRGNREIYNLNYFGSNESISITEDHKMLVTKCSNQYFIRSKFIAKPEWIEAQYITDKDYVCIPRNKYIRGQQSIDIELCWLLGLYMAEGHLRPDRGSIVLTLGSHETHLIERIKSFIHSIYESTVGVYPSLRDNTIRVEIYNQNLLEQFISWFGRKRAINKQIPSFLFQATDQEIQSFLDGYSAGDGYIRDNKNTTLTTASKYIAYGIQELMTRFGVLVNIYKRQRDTNYKKDTTIYRICWNRNSKHFRYAVDNDFIYAPIKSIRVSDRQDEFVYDITVENNTTFCIQNLATWDCWYEGPCPIGNNCWNSITVDDVVNICLGHLQVTKRLNLADITQRNLATINTEII